MHAETDLENSLSYLSEELDALGIEPVAINNDDISVQALLDVSSKLVEASWLLIHKYRSQLRQYDQLDDVRCKILNDNRMLKSRVAILRKDLEKRQDSLSQALERERRGRAEVERLGHEVKRLNDETVKLRKQLQSERNLHQHKLQQVVRSEEKHRERLESSLGIRRTKREERVQESHDEDRANIYEKTIRRLENNNTAMLREICSLKEALTVRSTESD